MHHAILIYGRPAAPPSRPRPPSARKKESALLPAASAAAAVCYYIIVAVISWCVCMSPTLSFPPLSPLLFMAPPAPTPFWL